MTGHVCECCGRDSSIFWWRVGLGCDAHGDGGDPVWMCDTCVYRIFRRNKGPQFVEGGE